MPEGAREIMQPTFDVEVLQASREVGPERIASYREKVPAEYLSLFDKLADGKKRLLATLDTLNPEELERLIEDNRLGDNRLAPERNLINNMVQLLMIHRLSPEERSPSPNTNPAPKTKKKSK